MKEDGAGATIFKSKILAYLQSKKGASEHLKKLAHNSPVLTDDEIKLSVETRVILSKHW